METVDWFQGKQIAESYPKFQKSLYEVCQFTTNSRKQHATQTGEEAVCKNEMGLEGQLFSLLSESSSQTVRALIK